MNRIEGTSNVSADAGFDSFVEFVLKEKYVKLNIVWTALMLVVQFYNVAFFITCGLSMSSVHNLPLNGGIHLIIVVVVHLCSIVSLTNK